jgi:hypothetical protein
MSDGRRPPTVEVAAGPLEKLISRKDAKAQRKRIGVSAIAGGVEGEEVEAFG